MGITRQEFTKLIKGFKIRELFNYMGWDNDKTKQIIKIDNDIIQIQSVAEKSGFRIILCPPLIDGKIPLYNIRRRINTAVTKLFQEHMIIYYNKDKKEQIWQYKARFSSNNIVKLIEIQYNNKQSPELLFQKTAGLYFELDEEDENTIVDVNRKFHDTFGVNAEKVTKRFYDGFKKVYTYFIKFIEGIDDNFNREWYASLMLNRLMFCYFIQRKSFLDDNTNYLRDKLKECQIKRGTDKFYTFYRSFLILLFHKGFGDNKRPQEIIAEIGQIPYLNGSLFDVHEIEQKYKDINIPDDIFTEIFDFFDEFNWHLDTRKKATGNEINPDVIGYIFEKYINDRAKMGAYYTQEDITEYISKNCIIPYLIEQTERKYPEPFKEDGFVWQLLKESGDRYIYDAVKHGVDMTLPEEIQTGIDITKPYLLERRKGWNKLAEKSYALSTETWREVVERRQRYNEVYIKITNGEIKSINDFITYNLNISQFVQDILETIDEPDLIRVFYKNMKEMSILDPTCGSGAFLFAALNILESLYETCIMRMSQYVQESNRSQKYKFFNEVISEIEQEIHPNKEYYIYKSIILNNLYGVDIMKEAVETAKLRMFLKLVSTVNPNYTKENLGLEPLPDIDFNIKSGNTLVGFTTEKELNNILEGDIYLWELKKEIINKCVVVKNANERFKESQLSYKFDIEDFKQAKDDLGTKQNELKEILDELYYKINGQGSFAIWKEKSKPFHWFSEFYEIVEINRGFDVVIGNPPYLEFSQINYCINNYTSVYTKAVHAVCIEKALNLMRKTGIMSMIVPLSLVSTQRMKIIQNMLGSNKDVYYSSFSWRPAKLFNTVNRALTVFIAKDGNNNTFTTKYIKWTSGTREGLFNRIYFSRYIPINDNLYWTPKFGNMIENNIIRKLYNSNHYLGLYLCKSGNSIYYRTTGGLYWKVFTDFSPFFEVNGIKGHSSRETMIYVRNKMHVHSMIALLSSNMYWWWYTVSSNLRDLNPMDINSFPTSETAIISKELQLLGLKYINDLKQNSVLLMRNQKQTGITKTQSFKIQKSKHIIDEIDKVLAEHYGFTKEELDFIINYDIKYRMGAESEDDE